MKLPALIQHERVLRRVFLLSKVVSYHCAMIPALMLLASSVPLFVDVLSPPKRQAGFLRVREVPESPFHLLRNDHQKRSCNAGFRVNEGVDPAGATPIILTRPFVVVFTFHVGFIIDLPAGWRFELKFKWRRRAPPYAVYFCQPTSLVERAGLLASNEAPKRGSIQYLSHV
ncbi:hypothetical protein AVEN_261413-1 [Araneus ventricosus]|uniref:Uncharacterized protein n=1 Tax=Araneus ventricosus TaxID=182803 RepID=A0A4Y2VPX1_ARAVE|nr:hypothetical protein AVEN_261413-1 [Araneus ventricosus]